MTIEYNPKSEEIEYVAEEIIDDVDLDSHILTELDFEKLDFEEDMLEYIRDHYCSGEA